MFFMNIVLILSSTPEVPEALAPGQIASLSLDAFWQDESYLLLAKGVSRPSSQIINYFGNSPPLPFLLCTLGSYSHQKPLWLLDK